VGGDNSDGSFYTHTQTHVCESRRSKNVAYRQAPETFSTFFVVVIKVFIALNENFSLPQCEFSCFPARISPLYSHCMFIIALA